ncbi:hypothetical protein GIB67_007802 [Kingdonia uniflora]|uniref:Uncharacterized protein n=1 Tax=Kingdonia uniflora TaxID=39325 RepID=A0A7J7N1U1_9MAGN|nr:hypothetical protein GIB67_007802 [Kingdonia uniflora]
MLSRMLTHFSHPSETPIKRMGYMDYVVKVDAQVHYLCYKYILSGNRLWFCFVFFL